MCSIARLADIDLRVSQGAKCTSPRVYRDDYFNGGGAGYSDYASEAEMLRGRGRDYGFKLARHARPGRMLDVGAAAGFILQGFVDQGWSGIGR